MLFPGTQDTLLCPPTDFGEDWVIGPLSRGRCGWVLAQVHFVSRERMKVGQVPRALASLCPKQGIVLYFMTLLEP